MSGCGLDIDGCGLQISMYVTTFTSFDSPGRGFALRIHTITQKFNARASALRMDSSSLCSPVLSPKFLYSAVEG